MKRFVFKGSCVYAIVNVMNGKRYIGSTVNFHCRSALHRNQLRHGRHENRHLQAAWKKYGEDAFVFGIVEDVSIEQMHDREQIYLDAAQPMVYNISKVSYPAALGVKRSEATKALMRKAAMERVAAGTNGFDNMTAEQKERWRTNLPRAAEANRGQKRSEATKARIRAAWVTRKRNTHCKHGHALTPDNVYWHRGIHKHCAACRKRVRAAWNARVCDMRKALKLINSRPHAA